MRKLALPEELLLQVQKPARYLGNEMHAVYKNRDIPVRFVMCFPDLYEIGMSHLGIQILYEMFNRRSDTWCERVFAPWTDMEQVLRDHQIPLFALESQDPVREFDFLGITLQFELCYTNVLQILDLAGIPLLAKDRTQEDPLVIGGGPCACNPEPVAAFFDLFYIGEGETSYDALLDLYREMKERKAGRQAFLRAASQIPGIYVPSLYEVRYGGDLAGDCTGEECGGLSQVGDGAGEDCSRLWQADNRTGEECGGLSQAGDGAGEDCSGLWQADNRTGEECDGLSQVGDGAGEDIGGGLPEDGDAERLSAGSVGEKEKWKESLITSFRPKYPDVPARVRRQVQADLDDPVAAPYPTKPLIPFITVTQDRVAVELQRGCIRGCRFCQAGMIYRPNRERKLETVRTYGDLMLANTGQDDILLSSLSSSDYSCIREIAEHVSKKYSTKKVKLNVPSLRIDAFSLDLMAKVQDVRRGSLTFAPEAGSQRLRDVINKGITEEEILAGAREAFRGGWSRVKLYFMLGLPTETEADRVEIAELADRICAAYYEEVPKPKRSGRCRITVSTSFFVPKPFTPFQWAPMYRPGDYLGFAATVNHAIYASHNHRSVQYSWHDAEMIYLEGVLARGDRRTAGLILEAYRRGARFDSWLETWDFARWEEAAAASGISMDFYALRQREKEEILPWDFIDAGVHRSFLWREWEKAHAGELTPDCREACSGCGAASYGCGVCRRPGTAKAEEPVQTEEQTDGSAQGNVPVQEDLSAGRKEMGQAVEPVQLDMSLQGNLPAETKERMRADRAAQTDMPLQENLPANAKERMRTDGAAQTEGHIDTENPVCMQEKTGAVEEAETAGESSENALPGSLQEGVCIRVSMRVAKYGSMKFIGHLELMRFLQKCLRRTDIQVRYSDGITPRMIMSTAMPLGLGLSSSGEYIDMELSAPVSTEHALAQLRPLMPEGLEILDFRQIGETVPAGGGTAKKPEKAMSVVAAAQYLVRFRESFTPPAGWQELLQDFVSQDTIPWTKETKKGFRTLDMKPLIYAFRIGDVDLPVFASRIGDVDLPVFASRIGDVDLPVFASRIGNMDLPACASFTGVGEKAKTSRDEEASVKSAGRENVTKRTVPTVMSAGWIYMCVCSRVGENLRPEQLIGEAFRRKGRELPEDALEIHRIDLLADCPLGDAEGPESAESAKAQDGEMVSPVCGRSSGRDTGFLPQRFISLGEMGHIC